MNPEQRRLVSKLKAMNRDLERWEFMASSMGYSWNTTRAYISAIRDKIEAAIEYIE